MDRTSSRDLSPFPLLPSFSHHPHPSDERRTSWNTSYFAQHRSSTPHLSHPPISKRHHTVVLPHGYLYAPLESRLLPGFKMKSRAPSSAFGNLSTSRRALQEMGRQHHNLPFSLHSGPLSKSRTS
ncbi:hypothetical protein PAXRUDRAFT_433749 [Paxillus rubicundulus Ve08.2h10]|uniref:Uncharacterized protein n=1 Tax=Paxillus rubicundulus Ve08.2h10 TaxID=930991 RepID=A0A0D0E9X8_9AGAM|nr:hypothetical protein PAXRUDRAFT_433749 [Paxillus rubicundulus Ve08.2h10]